MEVYEKNIAKVCPVPSYTAEAHGVTECLDGAVPTHTSMLGPCYAPYVCLVLTGEVTGPSGICVEDHCELEPCGCSPPIR